MDALKRAIAEHALDNFRFLPYQPRATLADSLAAADLHLVSLLPALEGLIGALHQQVALGWRNRHFLHNLQQVGRCIVQIGIRLQRRRLGDLHGRGRRRGQECCLELGLLGIRAT